MKKLLFVAAAALFVFAASSAQADNACQASDAACVDSDDVSTDLPIQGVVAAGATDSADPTTGYVFADGDASNAAVDDHLDGYIGLSGADGGLVNQADGDFSRTGGNCAFPCDLAP